VSLDVHGRNRLGDRDPLRAVPNVGDRACFFLSATPGGKQTTLYALKGTAIVTSSANVLGRSKRVASQAQLTAIVNALISAV
jgi:hypothetical protein